MQSRFIFLMAWRYLRGSSKQPATRRMIVISFVSILTATCALALTIAIITGFQQALTTNLQGIHAHIIIPLHKNVLSYKKIAKKLEDINSIASYSPNYYAHALLDHGQDILRSMLLIHGVDPHREHTTTALFSFLTQSNDHHSIVELLQDPNNVIIGEQLAKTYDITPGKIIRMLYTPTQKLHNNSFQLDSFAVTVVGIIKTGIEELDASLVIASKELLLDLWPHVKPSTISVKLQTTSDEKMVLDTLTKNHIVAHSWQALYPSLMAALKLEAIVSMLVVSLIALIASMNVGAFLFMIITSKRTNIALLRALGGSTQLISRIFFFMGIMLTLCAATAGSISAYIIGFVIKQYVHISLPDIYYTQYVPVNLNPIIFLGVLCFVMLLSSLSVWIACRSIKTLPVSETLRFEQ